MKNLSNSIEKAINNFFDGAEEKKRQAENLQKINRILEQYNEKFAKILENDERYNSFGIADKKAEIMAELISKILGLSAELVRNTGLARQITLSILKQSGDLKINSWDFIDQGFRLLMENNDSFLDAELMAKSKRLRHLGKFIETLVKRINERVAGVKIGDIQPLFNQYKDSRNEIDKN